MTIQERHWATRDEVTVEALAEFAKSGIETPHLGDVSDLSKSDLMKERSELRRGINGITDRAKAAIKKGENKEADRLLAVIDQATAWMDRLNNLITAKEMEEELNGAVYTSGNLGIADGNRFLANNQSLRSVANMGGSGGNSSPIDYVPKFGFGDFVKAMVAGTKDTGIRNALSEGTDSAGGYTVPTHLMMELIDRMRAKTVVIKAGAITVPLETQKTTIARLAADPTAGWRLENGAVAESDPTFEAVTFTARSLACLVKISRELLEDSINIENALLNAFAGSMAVELDRVALYGSGTAPEPKGIINTANIGTVDMGTNGAAITSYAPVLDAILELESDDAAAPSGIIMAPRTWRTLAGLTDTTGQPLNPPESVKNIRRLTTTTMPIDRTHGTATNASDLIVGDFTQLMIGVRTQLRIEVLRELFAENGQYAFLAHLRADVQLAHPESFAVVEGIVP